MSTQNDRGLNKVDVYFSVMFEKSFLASHNTGRKKEGKLSSRKSNTRSLCIRHELELSHVTILNSKDTGKCRLFSVGYEAS